MLYLRRVGERALQREEWLLRRLRGLPGVQLSILLDGALPSQEAILRAAAGAHAIVGAHGAGLANAIVAQPGACVVEIMPRAWFVPCYWRSSVNLGLRHTLFIVVGDKRSALVVNAKRVARAVKECIEGRRQ